MNLISAVNIPFSIRDAVTVFCMKLIQCLPGKGSAATDLTGMDAVHECSSCTQFEVIATDKPTAYGRVGSASVNRLARVLYWLLDLVKRERC